MDVIEAWAESQDFQLRLDSKGKIIDYFDEEIRRENKPEERVRQKMACILHKDFRYPINVISLEKTIKIGVENKRADILLFIELLSTKRLIIKVEYFLLQKLKLRTLKSLMDS